MIKAEQNKVWIGHILELVFQLYSKIVFKVCNKSVREIPHWAYLGITSTTLLLIWIIKI